MAGGKTLGMIRSLQGKEKDAFRETIGNKRNGALLRLFDLLNGYGEKDEEPSASEMFVTIKGEVWEPEKDYLLRNELRHLNRFLKQFMAERGAVQPVDASAVSHISLLQELGSRGEWKVFEQEFSALEKKALEWDDPITLAHAWRVYTRFLAVHAGLSERETLRALEKIKESMEWQRRAALRMQLLEWHRHEYFQRVAHSQRGMEYPGSAAPLLDYSKGGLGATDRYLLAKGEYYASAPSERLNRLEALAVLLQGVPSSSALPVEQEALWLDFAMGVEYYLNRSYSASQMAFERGITNELFADYPRRSAIFFNYLAVLLKARQYAIALKKMKEWDLELSQTEAFADRYRCQKAMTLLFNGELDGALETLQDYVSHTNSDTYIYFRLVRILVFYLRGNLETALTEMENLQQIKSMRRGEFPAYKACAKFVERYLLLRMDGPAADPKAYAQLKADIFAPEMTEVEDVLVTQWVVDLIVNG